MARIHHNTVKKAAKFGVTLTEKDGMIEASANGRVLSRHSDATKALAEAVDQMGVTNAVKALKKSKGAKKAKARKSSSDEDEDEEGEEGETDEDGRSVVKRRYKTKYRPFKMTCGDDLARQISSHVMVKDEIGKLRIDPPKLKRFAQANGVWQRAYNDLNVGMRRMNIANRLRAAVRKGHKVVWG